MWSTVGADHHWAVAFVDHGRAQQRHLDLLRLLLYSELVVVHDSEDALEKSYHINSVTDVSKYHYRWERLMPQSTVCSTARGDLVNAVRTLLESL